MLFAITSSNDDGSEKKVVAIQEGSSYKSVFDSLKTILERVATKFGEKFYMKNFETWGIDTTHYQVVPVNKFDTGRELEEHLVRIF